MFDLARLPGTLHQHKNTALQAKIACRSICLYHPRQGRPPPFAFSSCNGAANLFNGLTPSYEPDSFLRRFNRFPFLKSGKPLRTAGRLTVMRRHAQNPLETGDTSLRKRFYIIFVAREEDGRLRKIPVPMHYAYGFVAAAVVGAFTLAGMAGSYSRMLLKTAHFNQIRTEHEALRKDYQQLQAVTKQKEVQVASLGSLASEVSALYGLRQGHSPKAPDSAISDTSGSGGTFSTTSYTQYLNELSSLRTTALSGELTQAYALGINPVTTGSDWQKLLEAPTLWPVMGRITSSFGERLDPINGEEGSFHPGIDIAASFGTPVRAPADGVVLKAGFADGYGREIVIDHGNGISTVYGHLSGFAVTPGERVRRGQVIGYLGDSGRSTGPHLHYEVRIHDAPVNPHKYLLETITQFADAGGDSTFSVGN